MPKRKAPPGRTSISHKGVVKPRGPHHCAKRPGSVQALKTRRRGASKTRVMTTSRSSGWVAAFVLASMSLPLLFQLVQIVIQAIEALLPETAIVFQPVAGILERARPKPAGPPLRLATAGDQTGALEHLEMLRNGRKAHRERVGQLRDRCLARGEARKDRTPSGIGEGGGSGAQAIRRHALDNPSVK